MESYNIIRILIVIISGISIFLGFKLFYLVTERQGNLKIEGKDSSLTLSDVGPGVFFALFGSIVLISVLITQPYIDEIKESEIASENKGKQTQVRRVVERKRTPASVNVLDADIELLCVKDEFNKDYSEIQEYYKNVKWFFINEKYKEVNPNDKTRLLEFLIKINIPNSFISSVKDIKTYSDYYYILKSILLFYYINHKC